MFIVGCIKEGRCIKKHGVKKYGYFKTISVLPGQSSLQANVCVCVCLSLYLYTYIKRERERERERSQRRLGRWLGGTAPTSSFSRDYLINRKNTETNRLWVHLGG
jgi:hypothetical protein